MLPGFRQIRKEVENGIIILSYVAKVQIECGCPIDVKDGDYMKLFAKYRRKNDGKKGKMCQKF